MKKPRAALRALDARTQAIDAIEKRREDDVACPHCGHDRATRRGSTRTGIQRMRCALCGRTFSSSTGTASARIHSPARFHRVVAAMFSDHPRSCRRLGGALGLDKMTVWRWRRRSDEDNCQRFGQGIADHGSGISLSIRPHRPGAFDAAIAMFAATGRRMEEASKAADSNARYA